MIYLDNAATSGHKPQTVINAVNYALKSLSANPGRSGHRVSLEAANAVYKAREKVSNFFGGSAAENVVFTLNCTESINFVLKGVLKEGDHIIVSSMEHNAVMRPLEKLGLKYDIAEVSMENDEQTIENFKKKIKPNTRLIFCTAASNVTGKILPLKEIGEICKGKGILFGVDAAQAAGVVPINMKNMGIDYLCIAPHKGLYAPMGIGILICEKPIYNTIVEGGTGSNSISLSQPLELPERLESGTVNLPGILGVLAGVEFIQNKGIDRIYKYETMLNQKLYNGLLKNKNIELYTAFPKIWDFTPTISFNIKNMESGEVAQLLSEKGIAVRGGLHCAPTAHRALNTLSRGTVRVSVSIFNKESDIIYLLNILNSKYFIKN